MLPIIVTGSARSGTSLVMQMLQAGGVNVLTDGIHTPDDANPRGYLEHKRVQRWVHGETDWPPQDAGRVAVKALQNVVRFAPPARFIIARRDPMECAISRKTLQTRYGWMDGKIEELAEQESARQRKVDAWAEGKDTLLVRYGDVLSDPLREARRIAGFVGEPFDAAAAAKAVDPTLYRSRPDIIEETPCQHAHATNPTP